MEAKIEFADDPTPSARYLTQTFLMGEALVDTRWTGRYWSPSDRREADPLVPGPIWRHSAFGLELDGQSLHYGWSWDGSEELDDRSGDKAHAVVSLAHATRPVRVRVHTVLDGTAVLTRWLEIENVGDRPAALSQVWMWNGRVFPSQTGEAVWGMSARFKTVHGDYGVGWFADGKHSNEGNFRWRQIEPGAFEIGEDSGKSGWGHPICYLRDGKAGHTFVAQLAWSGNWQARVERHDNQKSQPETVFECIYLRMGPWAPAPQRIIAPGESLRTPEIHIGGIAGDLDDMVRELHEHQRRSVRPAPRKGGACLINYSAGTIGDKTPQRILEEADIAAEAGAEVFTIDAGWYGKPGESWGSAVGDWHPGEHLPDGFAPVVDYVHQKGLKMALWVWIEAAAANSPIIQEHPDWLLHRDGKPQAPQLDLSKPEVAAWVESEIARIVEDYGIDVFRLDCNAYPGEGGYNPRDGYDENTIWRHYDEFYAIWDRIRERFPHLILENCAGGGARTDLGIMARFDYTWISDYYPPPRGVRIMTGMRTPRCHRRRSSSPQVEG